MQTRCPTCASGYDLAPDILSDGRILRCAHCRDAWVHRDGPAHRDAVQIVAEASASRASVAPEPSGLQPRQPLAARAKARFAALIPRSRAGLPGTCAALVAAALLVSASATVACKARVVARFPSSAAIFATLGLPVNLSGLAIGGLRSSVVDGDGPPVLTLEGRITNLRPDMAAVPDLRIAVRDKGGRELYYWTAPAPKALLAVAETVLFRSRLTAPPRDGQNLAVSFVASDRPAARRRVAEATPPDR